MMKAKVLPTDFRDLERFLDWALPTETARRRKRESLGLDEITEFYDAVLPRMLDVLDHFRSAEILAGGAENVGAETRLLFTLMLAFSEASLSVEVHKSPIVPDGMPGDIWEPEHETVGWKNKPKVHLTPSSCVQPRKEIP